MWAAGEAVGHGGGRQLDSREQQRSHACHHVDRSGAFVPTATGLIYTGNRCGHELYELRGESIQSLNWIKLTEELSSWADIHAVAFPLPLELEVTCT